MIEFPFIVGILGWIAILLTIFIVLTLIEKFGSMKAKEIYLGGWITALTNTIAICSVAGEQIIKWGFIFAMLAILAISIAIRWMVASCPKETEGCDASTDWLSLGMFSIGATISTAVALFIYLVAS